MKAELVMIGTELLLGETVDTNAVYLADKLAENGIDLYYKSTVGDNWLRVLEVLSQALSRSDLVITSGGLGPTMDDLTREAVAALLNRQLVLDERSLSRMEQIFARLHRTMSVNNKKQAYLPEGAIAIENNWGTAPGYIVEYGQKVIISLPGVPHELQGMFEHTVLPYLRKRTDGAVLVSRVLHFVGIGESALEERLHDILRAQTNPTVAPYASIGSVKIRITAKSYDRQSALELIAPLEEQIRQRTEDWLYGTDDDTLEGVVGRELSKNGQKVAVAESCTGGLIASRLTDVPGSSSYFERGFVTYSNEAKCELLGVRKETLRQYGAVSEQTAQEMARGARIAANSDWGLGITGIAGPGGGTPEKPVGLVYMAVDGKDYTKVERHDLRGDRKEIKFRASQAALNLLRKAVINQEK